MKYFINNSYDISYINMIHIFIENKDMPIIKIIRDFISEPHNVTSLLIDALITCLWYNFTCFLNCRYIMVINNNLRNVRYINRNAILPLYKI